MQIDLNKLKPKTPTTKWQLWEKKNFNIHRGLVDWKVDQEFQSIDEIANVIRIGVKAEFKPGWLRGFGFGTILRFDTVPEDLCKICNHIDTRNKKDGVWQWAILVFDEDRVAIGIHTWLHGYLRPVFDSYMEDLERSGFQCISTDAEMGPLFKTISKIQSICTPLRIVMDLTT